MSRLVAEQYRHSRRFPRVSGDEPSKEAYSMALREFSPRERG